MTKAIDTLIQDDFHVAFRSCWNGTSALLAEEIILKGTRVSCAYKKKFWKLFNDPRISQQTSWNKTNLFKS